MRENINELFLQLEIFTNILIKLLVPLSDLGAAPDAALLGKTWKTIGKIGCKFKIFTIQR